MPPDELTCPMSGRLLKIDGGGVCLSVMLQYRILQLSVSDSEC